ncbi:hypothetical protein MUGA111182_11370 [Mucilaginibacter galii]|nr:hypothetical protein [Mucilaginibacter galii]
MIRYSILIGCIATFLFASCGQQMKMVKTPAADSLAVSGVWKQYVKALSSKNTRTLKRLSLPQVYCQPCAIQAGTDYDLVSADAFIKSMLYTLPKTRLWTAIKSNKQRILTERIKNYHPQNLKLNDDAMLELYDVWYVTPESDKIKGFESQRYAFQFVKEGGQYRFFGLTAVK